MASHIRIVVRDRRLLNTGMAVRPVRPVSASPVKPVQPPRSKGGDRAMLWEGLGIALDYFNNDGSVPISALTAKARTWADRYFKGYPYAANRPTALLRTFPDLFNLNVEAHLRLTPTIMSPPPSPEPEGASPRDLRRAERRAMNTEAFPEFAEPTLAPDSEIDQIVDLRTRSAASKPTMRVDAHMLRGSGLMSTLPEFLGQLARANLETETMLASNPDRVRFELDDDQAASQQHVEMNLFSGLIKNQRRRHRQGIVLPGDVAVKPPASSGEEDSTDEEDSGDESDSSTSTIASLQVNLRKRKAAAVEGDEDSSDESDASTSTAASLHANLKKRKTSPLEDSEDSEEASPPNKIRLHYNYPTPKLRHFDMKRRKLVTRPNPAAAPNDPFESLPKSPTSSANKPTAATAADRPTSSSSNSSNSSSSSSSGPVPITKIRVPSRSPDGSRSTSPDRIILLRHPVLSQSSREGSASLEEADSSGSSSSAGGSRRLKIKVVQNERREGEGRKRLIEEVE